MFSVLELPSCLVRSTTIAGITLGGCLAVYTNQVSDKKDMHFMVSESSLRLFYSKFWTTRTQVGVPICLAFPVKRKMTYERSS